MYMLDMVKCELLQVLTIAQKLILIAIASSAVGNDMVLYLV
jgi:hypothetical protein